MLQQQIKTLAHKQIEMNWREKVSQIMLFSGLVLHFFLQQSFKESLDGDCSFAGLELSDKKAARTMATRIAGMKILGLIALVFRRTKIEREMLHRG